jgi:hypothetical protein
LKPISGHTIAELIFSLKANLLDWRERWLNSIKFRLNTEYQIVYTNQNSNFYKHLIFKIMKKQILFLAFFVLALMAGTSSAFGQAVTWSAPQPFTCTDDALHPIAGKSYTYTATVVDPTGAGEWRFWATTDPDFITDNSGTPVFNTGSALTVGANQLVSASTDYNIAIGAAGVNTDGTIDITWSSTILAGTVYQTTPTFVVAYYVNADGCTDNIKVWELDPLNGFIVDVIAMDAADLPGSINDYGTTPETCVDVVESATYAAGAMTYNYGDNYLYFEFIAANFTGYWIPEFALTNLNGVQTVTYEYTLATPDTWAGTPPTWTPLVSGTTQISPDPSITDMTAGVSVFVRVTVDHANYENINGQTLTMTLDGINADGDYDVLNTDCTLPDPLVGDDNDVATSIITPRPDIQKPASTTSPLAPNLQLINGNEAN